MRTTILAWRLRTPSQRWRAEPRPSASPSAGWASGAGNAALEQVAAALPILRGLDSGVDLQLLPDLCDAFAEASGRPIPADRPIVGSAVFSHESGIHVDGLLKDPELYEIVRPAAFGRTRTFVPASIPALPPSGIAPGSSAAPCLPSASGRCARASARDGRAVPPPTPGGLSPNCWTRRAADLNDDRPSALCDGVLPLFYQLARTIALGDELQGVMDAAVKVIVENLAGAERVVLSVLNRRTGAAFIENAWGLTDEERSKGVYRMGEGITGYVVQTGDSLVVPDIAEEPAFLDRTGARRDVDTSRLAFICVPVKLGREVLGTLSVDLSNSGSSDLEGDRELLTVVAAMIAQAVQLHRARKEENADLREENRRLLEELADRRSPGNIVGNSDSMQALYGFIKKVIDKPTPVLILGESGTGKELVASALHYGSARKDKPFVRFNCAAIPENLAESEMFGFEKGAFTGAVKERIGRFEEADGGTLFMDEVGELSPSIQAKLLRVLQSRQFERIGGNRTITVDIRIVAATNRDLGDLVKTGAFREDLYYRLNVFPLQLPAARARVRHPPPRRPFRGEARGHPSFPREAHLHSGHRRPHGLPLAWQRARARERDRARRHPLRRWSDTHVPLAAHSPDGRDLGHALSRHGHPAARRRRA